MRSSIAIIIVAVVSLELSSCGYTVLQDSKPTVSIPRPKPDLALLDIQQFPNQPNRVDDSDPRPIWMFVAKVENVSTVEFDDQLILAWSVGTANINWGDYPRHAVLGRVRIAPGDTVSLSTREHHDDYVPGLPIRFALVTTARMSGAPFKSVYMNSGTTVEGSYTNNFVDIVIQ